MGLLAATLRWLAGRLIGFLLILGCLFALHLLIFRALPELQRTYSELERAPAVAAELEQRRQDLGRYERALEEARASAEVAVQQRREQLERRRVEWQRELKSLEERTGSLTKRLDEAANLQREYCESYNPFKRWFCSDMKRRFSDLEREINELRGQLTEQTEHARAQLALFQSHLKQLEGDPQRALQALTEQGAPGATTVRDGLAAAQDRAHFAQREVQRLEQELARLKALSASSSGWVLEQWKSAAPNLIWIALVVMLLPYGQRVLAYFVLMPLVARASPLRISPADALGSLDISQPAHTLELDTAQLGSVYCRAEFARPVSGAARSQLFYRATAPFISYAAGLFMLTRIDPDAGSGAPRLTLASPSDPNAILLRLDLKQHPGVVLHPRNVVALCGDVKLRTAWFLFSLHAWSTFQLRYIVFSGSGSIVLQGRGTLSAERLEQDTTRIEQKYVVGFESQLGYKTHRTETFLPYLVGKTPLVDDMFQGAGCYFWEKSPDQGHRSVTERTFDALFGAIGKLLGF